MKKKSNILIFIGIILILIASYNLYQLDIFSMFGPSKNANIIDAADLVDQAGFAPLVVPEKKNSNTQESSSNTPKNIPDRITIPIINLDAPIEKAEAVKVTIEDQEFTQFLIPEKFAAGWHEGSALLGEPGNTVLSGHNNAYGEVFANLEKLEIGDTIYLFSNDSSFQYTITNRMILPERDIDLEMRIKNAHWIMRSEDERITLVTCWPHESNTHRLILVAIPSQMANESPSQGSEGITSCSVETIENEKRQIYKLLMEFDSLYYESSIQNEIPYVLLIEKMQRVSRKLAYMDQLKCTENTRKNVLEYMNTAVLEQTFAMGSLREDLVAAVKNIRESYKKIIFSELNETMGSEEIYQNNWMAKIDPYVKAGNKKNPLAYAKNIAASNSSNNCTVNIREAPNLDSRVLGSLFTGRNIIVLGKNQDEKWIMVAFRSGLAWVNADIVDLNVQLSILPIVPEILIEKS